MAKKNDTTFFENKLLDFVAAKDPLLEMLQWMMDKFMEIEVARKTGAPKGSHSQTRTGYRCGYGSVAATQGLEQCIFLSPRYGRLLDLLLW